MMSLEEWQEKFHQAVNFEERRTTKIIICGWCGDKQVNLDGRSTCLNCDDYFVNERDIDKFSTENYGKYTK